MHKPLKRKRFAARDEKGNLLMTINATSLVSHPAIEKSAMMFASVQDKVFSKIVFKVTDSEKMEITGVAMTPNKDILRFDEATQEYYNCYFTEQDVEDFAEQFMKSATLNAIFEHDQSSFTDKLMVKESWIVRNPELDATKAMGFTDIVKGDWVLTYKTRDKELWNSIKESNLTGFSVELDVVKGNFKHDIMMSFTAKTSTGVTLTSEADALAVGVEVKAVDESGNAVDLTGEHTLENGTKIKVEGGKVTEVAEPELNPAETEAMSKLFAGVIELATKPLFEKIKELEVKLESIPAAPSKTEQKQEEKKELTPIESAVEKFNKLKEAVKQLNNK